MVEKTDSMSDLFLRQVSYFQLFVLPLSVYTIEPRNPPTAGGQNFAGIASVPFRLKDFNHNFLNELHLTVVTHTISIRTMISGSRRGVLFFKCNVHTPK